jgi:hypothetical protein
LGPGLFIIGSLASVAYLGEKTPDILTPIVFYCIFSSAMSIIIGIIYSFFPKQIIKNIFTICFFIPLLLGIVYLAQMYTQFAPKIDEQKVSNSARKQFDTNVYPLLESILAVIEVRCAGWNGTTKKRDTFCSSPTLFASKNTDLTPEEYSELLSILGKIIPHKDIYAPYSEGSFSGDNNTGYRMKVQLQISPSPDTLTNFCQNIDQKGELFRYTYRCEIKQDVTCQKKAGPVTCN